MKRLAILTAITCLIAVGANAEYIVNGSFDVTDSTATNYGWTHEAGTYASQAIMNVDGRTNVMVMYGGDYDGVIQQFDVTPGQWVKVTLDRACPNNSGVTRYQVVTWDAGFHGWAGPNDDEYCRAIFSGYLDQLNIASWPVGAATKSWFDPNWSDHVTQQRYAPNWGSAMLWATEDHWIQSRGLVCVVAVESKKGDKVGSGFPLDTGPGYYDEFSAVDDTAGKPVGDTDMDGDVDMDDLTTVFSNYTGDRGQDPFDRMTFRHGNFDREGGKWGDGDMDVDTNDVMNALAVYTGSAEAPVAPLESTTNADLIYNPATGEVTLDPSEAAGGYITAYRLFNGYAAAPYEFIDPENRVHVMAGTYEDSADELSEADPFTSPITAAVSLGCVMPTGMTQEELETFFTQTIDTGAQDWLERSEWTASADYVGALGSGRVTFDLIRIPEPATLALLGLGGLGALIRRRRS